GSQEYVAVRQSRQVSVKDIAARLHNRPWYSLVQLSQEPASFRRVTVCARRLVDWTPSDSMRLLPALEPRSIPAASTHFLLMLATRATASRRLSWDPATKACLNTSGSSFCATRLTSSVSPRRIEGQARNPASFRSPSAAPNAIAVRG